MSITKHHLSFFEYLIDAKLFLIVGSIAFILTVIFILSLAIKSKKSVIILTLLATIIVQPITIIYDYYSENNDYYSINGSAKITDIRPYSTNGNSNDNDTQTIYFIHNNHIYNIKSPDNTVIKKGDIINIKSSKYATTINNGTINKSEYSYHPQTLNIKIHSKN